MKNTFAKKVLLIGAVAVGLSAVVPAHAMDNNTLRDEAANSTMQENESRLKSLMHTLDVQWKAFMKCVKGDKSCTVTQIAIARTLSAIMIYVAALATYKTAKATGRYAASTKAAQYLADTRVGKAAVSKYDAARGYAGRAGGYVRSKLPNKPTLGAGPTK